jgi:DNA-directed RNA polymerase subunit RPC12/RpoP
MNKILDQKWICSDCKALMTDEAEYVDNAGVCDDCYSKPIKMRIGKFIK